MLSASKSGSGLSTGYNLTRSLRFRASASAYLNRTPSVAGNRKTWTWSAWVKRGKLGANQIIFISKPSGASDATFTDIAFSSSDTLLISGYSVQWRNTTQVFRDPSAWYHIVVTWDTTQATASNRVKVYVNGSQVTAFGTTFDPSLNFDGAINQADVHAFCAADGYSYGYFDGYLAEVNFIDGQALTPSSFGSTNATTGVWQPARYTGTYGTNGFYLPFTDNSALTTSSNVGLGKDFSGNGNYWTTNNISITAGVTYDSMTDVPTLTSATAANFCVFSPINSTNTGGATISNGNLQIYCPGSPATEQTFAGTVATPNNFYCEFIYTGVNNGLSAGILDSSYQLVSTGNFQSNYSKVWGLTGYNGVLRNNATTLATYGAIASGTVVAMACSPSTGKLWFGTASGGTTTWYASGNPATGANAGATNLVTSSSYMPYAEVGVSGEQVTINCGQQPFVGSIPSGFVALNTYNLPTSTIVKGNTVMDATLYTGTGANLTVTNAGAFKPDLVWAKSRSNAYYHHLVDSVRGVNRDLYSNDTLAEFNYSSGGSVTAFNSNGFSLGTQANEINTNAATFVAWQWQAGQGSTSSNTNGSITSTVSVNASAGFSIVTYTGNGTAGATVGHGLGVTPSFIYTITRSPSGNVQQVYHSSIGNTGAVFMNSTQATNTAANWWNNTSPTSSVFSLGNGSYANGSGSTMVAYCWTPIAGFSAMGSYLGNGSTSGPFVYCGFQPKFILIKSTTAARDWIIWDTARNTFNIGTAGVLFPDTSGAEYSGSGAYSVAVTSNGFYLPVATTNLNASGETHIYAAFATSPFKNSLAF